MIVEIRNEELAKTLKEVAYKEGVSIDKLVEDLLTFSLDHSISTLALKRIEYLRNYASFNQYPVKHSCSKTSNH